MFSEYFVLCFRGVPFCVFGMFRFVFLGCATLLYIGHRAQRQIAIDKIIPPNKAHCLPEGIAADVARESRESDLADAAIPQRISRHLHQRPRNAHAPAIRVDSQMVDKSTPSIMPRQDDTHDLAVS